MLQAKERNSKRISTRSVLMLDWPLDCLRLSFTNTVLVAPRLKTISWIHQQNKSLAEVACDTGPRDLQLRGFYFHTTLMNSHQELKNPILFHCPWVSLRGTHSTGITSPRGRQKIGLSPTNKESNFLSSMARKNSPSNWFSVSSDIRNSEECYLIILNYGFTHNVCILLRYNEHSTCLQSECAKIREIHLTSWTPGSPCQVQRWDGWENKGLEIRSKYNEMISESLSSVPSRHSFSY